MTVPPQFKFTPLEMFEWHRTMPDGSVRLIGQYWPGMTYNCTMEPVHDALREICGKWVEEGKIRIIPLDPGQTFKVVKVSEET